MAKAPASEQILAASKLRALLALSKENDATEADRLPAAIALTIDGDGLILIDKRGQPRAVEAALKSEAAKAKISLNTSTLRRGHAWIDPAYDPTMVRFALTKEAPSSMRARLVEVVKGAGYMKVELTVDESIEAEPETIAAAAPGEFPPPPALPQPALSAQALAAELAGLARRIVLTAGDNTSLRAELLKLANDANIALKANQLETVATTLHTLAERLGEPTPVASSAPDAAAATYAKSRQAWVGTRSRVEADITRLRAALLAEYGQRQEVSAIVSAYDQKVQTVLDTLDLRLAHHLDEAALASGQARTEKLAESKAIIAEYVAFLQHEPLIADLDSNPFVPLAIQKTVGTTLAALAAAVH
jgi:hypothetical protein